MITTTIITIPKNNPDHLSPVPKVISDLYHAVASNTSAAFSPASYLLTQVYGLFFVNYFLREKKRKHRYRSYTYHNVKEVVVMFLRIISYLLVIMFIYLMIHLTLQLSTYSSFIHAFLHSYLFIYFYFFHSQGKLASRDSGSPRAAHVTRVLLPSTSFRIPAHVGQVGNFVMVLTKSRKVFDYYIIINFVFIRKVISILYKFLYF